MSQTVPSKSSIAGRHFFLVFALLFNTLTWFYMIWATISTVLRGLQNATLIVIIIWTFFYFAVVGSGLFGSILSNKPETRFFHFWVLLGISSSLLPFWLNPTGLINTSIISLFFGISFGLGMPALLASFAENTNLENRGRSAGVIFFAINLSAPFFVILVQTFDLKLVSIILAAWRGSASLLLFYLRTPTRTKETRKTLPFSSILQHESFILYLVAWLLFCFVDNFEKLVLGGVLEVDFYSLMVIVETVIGSIFSLVGGWLCDIIGRKRVVIYGFVALGIAYAIISITPTTISWYLYFAIDGISGGMLLVAFVFVLWGDLSQHGGRDKYYAIGSVPYFFTPLIRVIVAPFVTIPAYFAFSLASFFLFVAVLPLMYAPETLPERRIELRKLRKYVEKAREVKERSE